MTVSTESSTDVLIIGAGPSGLAVAYWMAQYGINARIIDKRGTKLFRGHADGLRSRTLELFDSMGFAHRVTEEGYHAAAFMFWRPDGHGGLQRTGQQRSTIHDSSPYRMALLTQGRIERFFLDVIRGTSSLDVERGVVGESLSYDESLEKDPQAYPITVQLRTLSEEEATPAPNPGICPYQPAPDDREDLIQKRKHKVGTVETIRAKYLIGCDGAHSWTRKQLDIPFEGSHTDHIWGVMDVVPITDFPDIRWPSSIDGPYGHLLMITREGNMVRFYVPLQEGDEVVADSFDRSAVTLDMLRERVKKIMAPFYFDFKICHWWAAYQVGRRLTPTVNKGRMYLVGDAVHTHSPKIGLGMNMSIQDGFNLGWKLGLVLKGIASPTILETYASERHQLAQMVLDFDKKWASFFLRKEKQVKQELEASPEEPDDIQAAMREAFIENELFAEGHVTFYKSSPLVHKGSTAMAKNLVAGERFPAALIRNQADGQPWWTTRLLKSDGRFRILLLAGDVRLQDRQSCMSTLSKSLTELLKRFTPSEQKPDSVIEVKAIHSAPLDQVELRDFPPVVRQFDEDEGWDYTKVWSDSECFWNQQCKGNAYEIWGVDRSRGAMVVLRPDQYVGWMGELDDVAGVTEYFEGILCENKPSPVL